MLPALGLLAVLLLVEPILVSTANVWNDIRLAPVAALLRGYDTYYLPGEGPMLGHIYGPVAPFAYLPALLWSTPAAAIRAGIVLTLCWLTLPVVMMIRDRAGQRPVLAIGCLVLFMFLLHAPVVHLVAFGIHSDTPAVALAGLACFCLTDQKRRTQTGLRFVRLTVIVGIAAVTVVALTVDVPAMLYQALVIPSEHGWRYNDVTVVFVHTIRDLVPRIFLFAAVVGTYGLLQLGRVRKWSDVTRWAYENPWLVPVFVGIFCVPTSMLGRMKQGGSMNSLIFTTYPLLVGSLLAVLHAGSQKTGSGRQISGRAVTALLTATPSPSWRSASYENTQARCTCHTIHSSR